MLENRASCGGLPTLRLRETWPIRGKLQVLARNLDRLLNLFWKVLPMKGSFGSGTEGAVLSEAHRWWAGSGFPPNLHFPVQPKIAPSNPDFRTPLLTFSSRERAPGRVSPGNRTSEDRFPLQQRIFSWKFTTVRQSREQTQPETRRNLQQTVPPFIWQMVRPCPGPGPHLPANQQPKPISSPKKSSSAVSQFPPKFRKITSNRGPCPRAEDARVTYVWGPPALFGHGY